MYRTRAIINFNSYFTHNMTEKWLHQGGDNHQGEGIIKGISGMALAIPGLEKTFNPLKGGL